MQGAEVLTRFKADTKDFDSKTKSVSASISSVAKGVLAATGITKAFSAAWDMVRSSMDGAISRYDTMNNFPKVMSNLGIAADDAQKSIDLMSDKLTGLPTTLDEGALAVQRFTSANNDVKKSTDMFLALNNAILAGGAGAQIQSSALEQLSQAYAKGKPDMMEWRTMMMAMPAQLKQIATAMGYVNADELGVALREGTESMDDFMNTIIDLNTKGLDGFQNFEEQARNATNGIQTAMKNMRSRTVQGVTAMIEAVDKGLQDAKLGNIASVLENIGNFFRDNLKKLAPYITQFIVKLAEIGKWIIKNKDWLEAIIVPLVTFVGTFSLITKAIAVVKGITVAFAALNAVLLANPIVLIIAVIAALIAIFVLLWNKCEWFRNFWIGLWNGIKSAALAVVEWFKSIPENVSKIVTSVINFLSNLPYYIGYMIGYIIGTLYKFWTKDVPNFVNGIIQWFSELPGKLWSIITDVVGKVGQWFSNMWNKAKAEVPKLINNIVKWFKELPGKMLEIGSNIVSGIWQGIQNRANKFISDVKGFFKGIVKGAKDALGIKSPSKEFAMIGKFSILGYTEALDSMQSDVQKQIAETFALSPQLSATNGMHYSPNVNVVNNVDIKQDPLGQMVNNIKTYAGGAKNDYNYGAGF
jgi:tape measure domain-containing protein